MKTGPSKRMNSRALRAFLYLFLCVLVVIGSLASIQIINSEEYRLKAEKNQLRDTQIAAERGTIYDSGGKVLAKSASAWLVYINPSKIKGDAQRDTIVNGLCEILELEPETVRPKTERVQNGYEKIAGKIETEKKDKVSAFIKENELYGIVNIDPDTKRYYPYLTFASTILGFVGVDDDGRAGLELKYNEALTGVPGRIITAKNAKADAMPNDYETTYDAQQGKSLKLTIDEVIQYYLEQSLDQAMLDTGAKYAYGIIMDVKTGAILGMTSKPDFDLNAPNRISNQRVAEELAAILDEDERNKKTLDARYSQWRNRAISDTYEPGSVFKTVVASAAIEENVANENTTYTCTGSIRVADRTQHCWKRGGHGTQTFTQGLMNSCNPFFITVGQALGKERFYKYFEAFGFTEPTGIDLPAEAKPVADVTYHSLAQMGISELSSSSFGQTFRVTPLQMITAISAIANGGKLMQPYLVDSILDSDQNVIQKTQPTVKRQVISEKTASRVAGMMEQVVSIGTGKNAYVAGYRVAGKTGTSEKIGQDGAYIASFAGFAPFDNPEIAIIIAIDEPVGDHGGGAVAAPIAGEILEKVLTYKNIEPQYNEGEIEKMISTAPNLVGLSREAAQKTASGFKLRIVGDGDAIVSQMPAAKQQMPKSGVIVLYTDKTSESVTAKVPDLTGLTISQANSKAIAAGFNIKIAGNTNNKSEVISYKQSLSAGEVAQAGSVITVYFKSTVNVQDSVN